MTEATEKAGAIERDIVETQNNISDTVEKLKERLTPQSLLNSVMGDDKQGFDQIVSLAKRNPFAVAMIGAGAAWLMTGKEAKLPSLGKTHDRNARSDPHRAYVEHMARIEIREGETPQQIHRRRDLARSDYFMVERAHEEDEPSVRKRLDEASESLRARTAAFGNKVTGQGHDMKARLSNDADRAREKARAATEKAKRLYRDNAMIGGLVAVAAGALAGSTLPTTQIEQDKLGDVADTARKAVNAQKDKLIGQAEKTLGAAEKKLDRPTS